MNMMVPNHSWGRTAVAAAISTAIGCLVAGVLAWCSSDAPVGLVWGAGVFFTAMFFGGAYFWVHGHSTIDEYY